MVARAAPSIAYSPITVIKIGSRMIFSKAPSPIIIMAFFIRPSPRITMFADCVKFTKREPIKITLRYLIP